MKRQNTKTKLEPCVSCNRLVPERDLTLANHKKSCALKKLWEGPAIEVTEKYLNDIEELESLITLACEKAGYPFGIGEGCPVAASAAYGWFLKHGKLK